MAALVVLVAGCVNQGSKDCSDTGCPLNLSEVRPSAPNCGDGVLESPEECDIGFPCKSGFCQQCRCAVASAEEVVSDCQNECKKLGYRNSTVTPDGQCTYPLGKDDPCAIRCSYRKVLPMAKQGEVCCCRELLYIKCKNKAFQDKCDCPSEEESKAICREKKPGTQEQ